MPFNNSSQDQQHVGFSSSLLSLSINSGSFSHTFDFTQGLTYGYVYFQDYALSPPTYTPSSSKFWQVAAVGYSDTSYSIYNYFNAHKQRGASDGSPFDASYAYASQSDYNNNYAFYGVANSNVTFNPDPTAIPTPALVPGLIGLGLATIRKRKAALAAVAEEAQG